MTDNVTWAGAIVTLAPNLTQAVQVTGGVLCLWLGVRVLGDFRTAAERYERSARALKWVLDDAHNTLSAARTDITTLNGLTALAAQQLPALELSPLLKTKVDAARDAGNKRAEDMLDALQRLMPATDGAAAGAGSSEAGKATSPNPYLHSDRWWARYIAAAVPAGLAAYLLWHGVGLN